MQAELFQTKSSQSNVTRFMLLFGLSVVACLIARIVSFGGGTELLIWPGAAVAFAAGWHFGRAWALVPALGCAIWAFAVYRSPAIAVAAALCSCAGPLLAIYALKRFSEWKPSDHGLNVIVRFIFVVLVICTPISATIATAVVSTGAITLFGGTSPIEGGAIHGSHIWLHWWLIDALGILLFTPALLAWLGNASVAQKDAVKDPLKISLSKTRFIDAASFTYVAIVAAASYLLNWLQLPFYSHAILFLYFPIVAWIAISNSTLTTTTTLLISALPMLASRAAQVRLNNLPDSFAGALSQTLGGSATIASEISVLVFSASLLALVLHSIANDRRLALMRVARQAREDLSTGLLNDRGLLMEFEDTLNNPDRKQLGLIGIHLTNFDSLSDLCGAMQALHLEQSTASLLKRQNACIVAARLSAGRYAIVVQADTVVAVRTVARELYTQMTGQSFKTENGSLRLQACVGGLLIDQSAVINSEECLCALADAMTIAASVRDPQLFVEPLSQTMIDARRTHQEKIEHVREAIREQRIELYAQRILELKGPRDDLNYEILTRLRGRDGKLILPPEFIPLTVQAQMSVALDRAVVQKTFEWLSRNPRALNQTTKCSINLSGLTLGDASIASFIFSQRVLNDIPAEKIVFEITESEAIRNPAAASRLVDSLKAEGFGIALDDFGTGLATFEYLKRFAIDYLKIDGSFVRTLKANSIDEEIVRATIRVARHLGVKTVAEHVHQQSILDLLQNLGVDCIQGALVGMPEPINTMFETEGLLTH